MIGSLTLSSLISVEKRVVIAAEWVSVLQLLRTVLVIGWYLCYFWFRTQSWSFGRQYRTQPDS
jgi:hypothetical protein